METEGAVGLRIEVSFEGGWQCCHCRSSYPYNKRRLQLFSKDEDPLFHNILNFCLDCGKLVAEKMKQIIGLYESVREEDLSVQFSAPHSDADGSEHRGPLGSESQESEAASVNSPIDDLFAPPEDSAV